MTDRYASKELSHIKRDLWHVVCFSYEKGYGHNLTIVSTHTTEEGAKLGKPPDNEDYNGKWSSYEKYKVIKSGKSKNIDMLGLF